jgi:BCD family chlorophyll transporter-like MFS transporter
VETAGTFIGAWGLAQAMARGLATVCGGGLLNLGKAFLTTPLQAYGLVFAMQAVGILVALWFLSQVNVTEFQNNAKLAIASILENDLD